MKVFKTGICSYGMSGKLFHAPFLHAHPGYSLDAIVERHNNDSAEKYPDATIMRSVEDLCAIKEVEVVIVNTPSYLHFEHALLALETGKHIVIEKPFAVNIHEANELASIAEKKGLFLSVYQNRRYDGDFLAVHDVINSGTLGELKEVEIRYDRYRPVFGGKRHKEGDLPGAGILYDLSPHLVDQAIQLFGFPDGIFADLIKMRDDVGVPDYFEILFFYPRLRVRLKATCIALESDHAYVLHGTKGSFLQHRSDLQETALLAGTSPSSGDWCPAPQQPDGVLNVVENGKPARSLTTSRPGNYMRYYEKVYDALCGKGPNPVPAKDGIMNTRIIEAALLSAAQKKIVQL